MTIAVITKPMRKIRFLGLCLVPKPSLGARKRLIAKRFFTATPPYSLRKARRVVRYHLLQFREPAGDLVLSAPLEPPADPGEGQIKLHPTEVATEALPIEHELVLGLIAIEVGVPQRLAPLGIPAASAQAHQVKVARPNRGRLPIHHGDTLDRAVVAENDVLGEVLAMNEALGQGKQFIHAANKNFERRFQHRLIRRGKTHSQSLFDSLGTTAVMGAVIAREKPRLPGGQPAGLAVKPGGPACAGQPVSEVVTVPYLQGASVLQKQPHETAAWLPAPGVQLGSIKTLPGEDAAVHAQLASSGFQAGHVDPPCGGDEAVWVQVLEEHRQLLAAIESYLQPLCPQTRGCRRWFPMQLRDANWPAAQPGQPILQCLPHQVGCPACVHCYVSTRKCSRLSPIVPHSATFKIRSQIGLASK